MAAGVAALALAAVAAVPAQAADKHGKGLLKIVTHAAGGPARLGREQTGPGFLSFVWITVTRVKPDGRTLVAREVETRGVHAHTVVRLKPGTYELALGSSKGSTCNAPPQRTTIRKGKTTRVNFVCEKK